MSGKQAKLELVKQLRTGLITGAVCCAALLGNAFAAQASQQQDLSAVELAGPAQDIETFLDGFFARFSTYAKKRRENTGGRAMIPLLRHARAAYERSPASERLKNPADSPTGLIAKLWMHGPQSWVITEFDWLEDSAFAKVYFKSVDESRPDPIPFGFKFFKAGTRWKIGGYVDLRSLEGNHDGWHNLIVEGNPDSPEAVFTSYMDKIEEFYSPKRAKESMKIAPQVQENLAPMWLPTEDATKSLGRAMMTFSQLQPRNWQFVSSDFVDEKSELVIQASAGNPVMRRNLGMAAMMGSGMKFTLERVGDEWLLKSYGRSGSKK